MDKCLTCNGTGVVNIQYGGDGYGDRCAALADAEGPCPDCDGTGEEQYDPDFYDQDEFDGDAMLTRGLT